jgi:hypothetical protein
VELLVVTSSLLLRPACGALVVVKRLRPGACADDSTNSTSEDLMCAAGHSNCAAAAVTHGSCARMAVLKVPRTGSTWLTKELRAFGPGVQLEFEPFTDPLAHACAGRFYTQALIQAVRQRLRCVTRESRSLPCYWGWLGCNATRLKPRPAPAPKPNLSDPMGVTSVRPGALLTGFLINPMYVPGAIWNRVLSAQPRTKLVWLRRTNLVKMALSDIRRLAGAAARQRPASSRMESISIGFVEPLTLITRLNMTLVTQATFPAAISLE